ncbi:peptidylprolyl isomerase [Heyndrickxia coagulans]|uniref:Foldase protein PrsA n=1 Tax=Heyndrickxia coagulans DSM 1 = ATCC 7050 TaxID=1121088 RepID=A0A8B4BTC9_HEYCO|nr:peptidylprolyl isomerase [Heyndrickxia coagulans]AJH79638.1 foldase protein prsA 1 [Heyndrickxia coagulans DSM 1 = ATCC 7050]MBF8418412.1 peptidylprolyl isomerase [Heyndrickxia coagulans]MCR2845601.1 peptidylprolyl isomerase [Heyndrickxia coagulans]MDR4223510.1 peptidylprolyl isomerase PrsA [Heyndrickxia coagulans DSM 1 = ATCC 7050]MEC5268443.1 peptidylprolyl isomerase [Heyndrickxia coagulans]
MKKWVLSLVLAGSVFGLAACGNSGNSAVVKTKAGNVTKDELYNAMKDKYGSTVLQQLTIEKVLSKKYTVKKSEVDKQVNDAKKQLGSSFDTALQQYGYANEKDFRNSVKVSLLEQKAAEATIHPTEKQLKNYYNNDIKPEIRARHILVSSKSKAEDIKKQLDKGADFATLAKKYSTDTATASKGGDLGWFGAGEMDSDFENAAYKLKVNEISGPVKTSYGYHIIQLTGEKKKKPYSEMKKDVVKQYKASKVTTEKIQSALKKELKAADVKVKDEDLKTTFDSLLGTSSSK